MACTKSSNLGSEKLPLHNRPLVDTRVTDGEVRYNIKYYYHSPWGAGGQPPFLYTRTRMRTRMRV